MKAGEDGQMAVVGPALMARVAAEAAARKEKAEEDVERIEEVAKELMGMFTSDGFRHVIRTSSRTCCNRGRPHSPSMLQKQSGLARTGGYDPTNSEDPACVGC